MNTHTHTHTHTHTLNFLFFNCPESRGYLLNPTIFLIFICYNFKILISPLTVGQWQSHHNGDLTSWATRILRQIFYYLLSLTWHFPTGMLLKCKEPIKQYERKYCGFLFPKKRKHQILISQSQGHACWKWSSGGQGAGRGGPTLQGYRVRRNLLR